MDGTGKSVSSSGGKKCPVEEKKLERVDTSTGVRVMVPSLVSPWSDCSVFSQHQYVHVSFSQDKVWTTEVNFIPFTPPSYTCVQGGGVGGQARYSVDPVWVEAVQMLDDDLHWLLQTEYHKFWSQVLCVCGRQGPFCWMTVLSVSVFRSCLMNLCISPWTPT